MPCPYCLTRLPTTFIPPRFSLLRLWTNHESSEKSLPSDNSLTGSCTVPQPCYPVVNGWGRKKEFWLMLLQWSKIIHRALEPLWNGVLHGTVLGVLKCLTASFLSHASPSRLCTQNTKHWLSPGIGPEAWRRTGRTLTL